MPRRTGARYIWGYAPWLGLWSNKSDGPSPHYGLSPAVIWLRRRGRATASHPAAKPRNTVKRPVEANRDGISHFPKARSHAQRRTIKCCSSAGRADWKRSGSPVIGWRKPSSAACRKCLASLRISALNFGSRTVLSLPPPYTSSPTSGCFSDARCTRI